MHFVQGLDTVAQLQACRYLKLKTVPCGTALFNADDVGDTLYIVLQGNVECIIEGTIASATVRLECGPGDCFGEQSLKGENEGRRDATVHAVEDCKLAVMERADYLRVTGMLTSEVMQVLAQKQRPLNELALNITRSYFHSTGFFHRLHYALLQYRCCNAMTLVQLSPGKRLYQQGTIGDCFYIIVKGKVCEYVRKPGETAGNGTLVREVGPGEGVGENSLTGTTNAERLRTETTAVPDDATEKVYAARLLQKDYIMITEKLDKAVMKTLESDIRYRKPKEIELLFKYFEDEQFFKVISLDAVRLQCCKVLQLQRANDNDVIFNKGDKGELFYTILRGHINVSIDDQIVRQMAIGESFGELALLGTTKKERMRTATVTAVSATDTESDTAVFATMSRDEYRQLYDQQVRDLNLCLAIRFPRFGRVSATCIFDRHLASFLYHALGTLAHFLIASGRVHRS